MIITTPQAPSAIGPYSQAVQHGNLVFCSGQIGLNPETMLLEEGLEAQTRRVFSNIQALCQAAKADLQAIIKLSIFLTDMHDFSRVNEIMQATMQQPFPARSCFAVAALPKNALIEIEAIIGLSN